MKIEEVKKGGGREFQEIRREIPTLCKKIAELNKTLIGIQKVSWFTLWTAGFGLAMNLMVFGILMKVVISA